MVPCGRRLLGALLAAALLPLAACSDDSPSRTAADAIPVNGSERLAWEQLGDVAELRFVAYVDGVPVRLDGASCDRTSTAPQGSPCLSPMPPLSDGVHTIALTALSLLSGLESARSEAITVQKLSARAVIGGPAEPAERGNVLQIGDRAERPVARTFDDAVTTATGETFDVRVVANGLDAPTALALTPDGRLFVAEQTGRVLILRTGARAGEGPSVAFDARAMPGLNLAGPPGLALHPDFARTRLVYLGYIALDPGEQPHLRIVRLREAGDVLVDPALVADEALAGVAPDGPSLAFGPDRLLYVALARGIELPPEAPGGPLGGAFLRIAGDGGAVQAPEVFASGVEQPVAFAWHPGTGALWAALAGADGRATLRATGAGEGFGPARVESPTPPLDAGGAFATGGLAFARYGAGPARGWTAWLALPDNESLWRVTPGDSMPADVLLPHALGRLGAIVAGEGGELFVATRNRDGRGSPAAEDDLIVRLGPRQP